MTNINGITKDGVHYWGASNGLRPNRINLDVPNHGFMSFGDIDSAVNWLYVNGFKIAAKALNQVKHDNIITLRYDINKALGRLGTIELYYEDFGKDELRLYSDHLNKRVRVGEIDFNHKQTLMIRAGNQVQELKDKLKHNP